MVTLTAFLQDPVMLALLAASTVGFLVAAGPRRRRGFWLLVLTIMLFGLPRAGLVIRQVHLPLPLAHVLAALVIIEWFVLRRARASDKSRVGAFALLYGSLAALGLVIGLTIGGSWILACLELCFYLFSLGLYFYASDTFCSQGQFRRFAQVLLVISVAVSLYGIAQQYLGASILIDNVTYTSASQTARGYLEVAEGSGTGRRVLSSYGDPNVLSTQLVFFVAIGMALAFGRGIRRSVRLLSLLVVLVNVVCIIYTGSRAGLVCLALVTLAIMCWRSRWALRMVLPVIAMAVAVAYMFGVWGANAGEGSLFAGDARWDYPRIAWHLLQTVPLGSGFGNTVRLMITAAGPSSEVVPATVIWSGFNSFWLNLLSRLGVPGVLSLMLLVVVLMRHIIRQLRMVSEGWVRAFVVGGLIGLGCQWLVGLANNTYMLPGGSLNYWFLMGMLLAGCRAFALRPYPVIYPLPQGWERMEPEPVVLSVGGGSKKAGKKSRRRVPKEKIRESCILIDE